MWVSSGSNSECGIMAGRGEDCLCLQTGDSPVRQFTYKYHGGAFFQSPPIKNIYQLLPPLPLSAFEILKNLYKCWKPSKDNLLMSNYLLSWYNFRPFGFILRICRSWKEKVRKTNLYIHTYVSPENNWKGKSSEGFNWNDKKTYCRPLSFSHCCLVLFHCFLSQRLFLGAVCRDVGILVLHSVEASNESLLNIPQIWLHADWVVAQGLKKVVTWVVST